MSAVIALQVPNVSRSSRANAAQIAALLRLAAAPVASGLSRNAVSSSDRKAQDSAQVTFPAVFGVVIRSTSSVVSQVLTMRPITPATTPESTAGHSRSEKMFGSDRPGETATSQ